MEEIEPPPAAEEKASASPGGKLASQPEQDENEKIDTPKNDDPIVSSDRCL